MADLATRAGALLQLVVAVAADREVSLPSRRYVAAGTAGAEAWDGEQVTVGLSSLDPSPAAVGAGSAASRTQQHPAGIGVSSVTLRVEIVRAVPSILDDERVPSPTQLHTAGLDAMRDVDVLRAALVRAQRSDVLTDGAASARVGQITTSGPEGGFAAAAASITFDLL